MRICSCIETSQNGLFLLTPYELVVFDVDLAAFIYRAVLQGFLITSEKNFAVIFTKRKISIIKMTGIEEIFLKP